MGSVERGRYEGSAVLVMSDGRKIKGEVSLVVTQTLVGDDVPGLLGWGGSMSGSGSGIRPHEVGHSAIVRLPSGSEAQVHLTHASGHDSSYWVCR